MASATEVAAPPAGVSSPAVRVLRENLGDQVLKVEEFRGDLAITVARKAWVKAGQLLRDHPELDFKLFLDLCGVDYLDKDGRDERFEVVLHLYSVSKKHHIRLKTPVPEADAKVDTLTGLFKGANWFERETIKDAEAEIGYMHRNFEKMAEERTYWQIVPYTDRLNYCSSFMNGHGWALAVEKLLGVPAPPRAEAIRVILSELSRIMDHIIAISTNVVDLGAITPFFVMFRAREDIYDLLEACCGARLTVSYVRIGGLAQDVAQDSQAWVGQ